SKRKPIHYSQTQPLSDSQFRGMSTDHANGIYYGLKAGVQNVTAANIHAADWSYVSRPQGGIPNSPYRVDDFWGYEMNEKYPTLSGSGLSNGQEAIYTNNTNITTTLMRSNLTSIVDVAEVIGNSMDYTKLYLCVLVGNKARAMLNKDTGTVTPVVYNGVEYRDFCFPDMSGIINTNALPMTAQVSVFLVGSDGIATFRDSWVDLTTAINIGTKPVTLPFQVNLSMTFKAAGKIYITYFNIEETTDGRGNKVIYASFTKGSNWEEASSYRILYTITPVGSQAGSAEVLISKSDTSNSIPLGGLMSLAGFWQSLTPITYSLQGDFQYDDGSGWKTTGYMKTITVTY
ncbi:MAG: hypothetical protein II273_03045, partial [Lachnospiraceae bacterium]|nr:hypothetical protein [Lachnospiraceae bacterium]